VDRRSFLKWFGAVTATAVVTPAVLPKIAEAMGPSVGGAIEEPLVVELTAYDFLAPSMAIYPVFTPFHNAMPRAMARLMLHEDRTILFGKEEAERLRLRDEVYSLQEVASIAS
jgi:hypothetical protein